MAKEYNVSVDKAELDTYMNESFASFTESEKNLLASMNGSSTFEKLVKEAQETIEEAVDKEVKNFKK